MLALMRGAIPPQLSTEGFFMTKITKGKVREDVAGLKMSRDGDDLVVRFVDLYATRGIATATGKDTRKLASSPGMFYWVKDGDKLAHPNAENRRLGLKVTAILGAPRDVDGTAKDKAAKEGGRVMSSVFTE